jgi:predicted GNAT family N-acyltransferase
MASNYPLTMPETTEFSESSIEIGIATTPAEKKKIYRLRYQVYVEEMSKHIASVDHANKLLYDELDEWAFLLYAKIGSEVVGTARINIGTLGDFPQKLIELLSLDIFRNCPTENSDHKFSYSSKLMVAPSFRSSPILYRLTAMCYDLSCRNQVQFGFSACNVHLLRLYEQMGFHRYSQNFVDPGYGLLLPVVMPVDDIQHFRIIRSPLFRIARKKKDINAQAVEWFHENFTRHLHIINSQLVEEEELWSMLDNKLEMPPTEAITILHELSVTEAKRFLHCCGSLVQCAAGDIITNQGDISYSHNILLSGRLKSLTFQRPVKEYTAPGQHFGANGLTEHTKHTEDIVAIEAAEILVLSGMAFQRFFHSHPEIAHKIVQTTINLARNTLLSMKRI